MSEEGEDNVVDLKKKRDADMKAALASARALAPVRIWKTYRTGPIQIGDQHISPGEWREHAGADGLPSWCPVTPLGRDDDTYYFLNVGGGISTLTADKCGKGRMASLFAGATGFLVHAFPRHNKEGEHTAENWANEAALNALFNAAHWKGAWSGAERVRGRGAWRAANGGLILHLGDKVHAGGKILEPGEYGEHVYVWRPMLPAPATREDERPAGEALLDMLMTWNWRRGIDDARLMLGFIGAMMIGGWLVWRPNMFLTGERAVGKSQLQKFVKAVGGDFFVETHDATAAGLHQYLGYDSVGVGVDEMEADPGSRKTAMVIELARRASSGGRILRGGANHKGQDFIIQSCFLFSAIAPPSMRGQDVSRLSVLELRRLKNPGSPPNRNTNECAWLGAQYLKRLKDWVARPGEEGSAFEDLMAAFRAQLMAQGHEDRTALQFGTLLACAWASLHNDMPETEMLDGPSEIMGWCASFQPSTMIETQGQLETWQQCFNHLLLKTPEPLKNSNAPNASSIIERLRRNLDQGYAPDTDDSERLTIEAARNMLAKCGLGLTAPLAPGVNKPGAIGWANVQLFVPHAHPELSRLFEGTDWQAQGGAEGTWKNVLRQMDEALWENRRSRVSGWRGFGTCIALAPLYERYYDEEKENG